MCPQRATSSSCRTVAPRCSVETVRLWLDLGFYSDRKGGKFCINGVTGPDGMTVVNNNAYTNLMARENLRYAAQTVGTLHNNKRDVYTALVHKTGLAPAEVEAWQRAAESRSYPMTRSGASSRG